MTTLREGDLQIDFPQNVKARRFDGARHGLSHCMKAVDAIVEENDEILFIEFKDPEHPGAKKEDEEKFFEELRSGELDRKLIYKYRDSFLYEWASGNVNDKKIHYCVLIAIAKLAAAELDERTNALKRKLPLAGPSSGIWKRRIVENCVVLNIAAWNKHFPHYQVTRISSGL